MAFSGLLFHNLKLLFQSLSCCANLIQEIAALVGDDPLHARSPTHLIHILHPVDAVAVTHVGLNMAVVIAGIRGFIGVGSSGGIH